MRELVFAVLAFGLFTSQSFAANANEARPYRESCVENLTSREDLIQLLNRFLPIDGTAEFIRREIGNDPGGQIYLSPDFLKDPLGVGLAKDQDFAETQLYASLIDQTAYRALVMFFKHTGYFELDEWGFYDFTVASALMPEIEYIKYDIPGELSDEDLNQQSMFVEIPLSEEFETALSNLRGEFADELTVFAEDRRHGLIYNHSKDILIDLTYRQFLRDHMDEESFAKLPTAFIGSLQEYKAILSVLPEWKLNMLLAAKSGGYSPEFEATLRKSPTLNDFLVNPVDAASRVVPNSVALDLSDFLVMLTAYVGPEDMKLLGEEVAENYEGVLWGDDEEEDFEIDDPVPTDEDEGGPTFH